jgi:hypothetical protein
MMIALFDLASNYRRLSDTLEESEFPEEVIKDTLDGQSGELSDKIISIAKWIKNLEASAKSRREAATEMLTRADSEERRIASLKQYLLDNMEFAGLPKVDSPWFVVSVKTNSPSTIIDDQSLLPSNYLREVPASFSPDKRMIKDAIKAGFDVKGAHLESTKTVVIK